MSDWGSSGGSGGGGAVPLSVPTPPPAVPFSMPSMPDTPAPPPYDMPCGAQGIGYGISPLTRIVSGSRGIPVPPNTLGPVVAPPTVPPSPPPPDVIHAGSNHYDPHAGEWKMPFPYPRPYHNPLGFPYPLGTPNAQEKLKEPKKSYLSYTPDGSSENSRVRDWVARHSPMVKCAGVVAAVTLLVVASGLFKGDDGLDRPTDMTVQQILDAPGCAALYGSEGGRVVIRQKNLRTPPGYNSALNGILQDVEAGNMGQGFYTQQFGAGTIDNPSIRPLFKEGGQLFDTLKPVAPTPLGGAVCFAALRDRGAVDGRTVMDAAQLVQPGNGVIVGRIVAQSPDGLVQAVGADKLVIHDARALTDQPGEVLPNQVGKLMMIAYGNYGRATMTDMSPSATKESARTR